MKHAIIPGLFLAAAGAILAGCATFTLSEQEAIAYANLDVKQFVKARYWGDKLVQTSGPDVKTYLDSMPRRAEAAARNAISSSPSSGWGAGMVTNARASDAVERATRIRDLIFDDGSVTFRAVFTDVNPRQLYRPYKEFSYYCKAQGGELYRTAGKGNASYFGYRTMDDRRAVEKAVNDKVFGNFLCNSKAGARLWEVSISPTRYAAGDPMNQLIPPEIEIAIVPVP